MLSHYLEISESLSTLLLINYVMMTDGDGSSTLVLVLKLERKCQFTAVAK